MYPQRAKDFRRLFFLKHAPVIMYHSALELSWTKTQGKCLFWSRLAAMASQVSSCEPVKVTSRNWVNETSFTM